MSASRREPSSKRARVEYVDSDSDSDCECVDGDLRAAQHRSLYGHGDPSQGPSSQHPDSDLEIVFEDLTAVRAVSVMHQTSSIAPLPPVQPAAAASSGGIMSLVWLLTLVGPRAILKFLPVYDVVRLALCSKSLFNMIFQSWYTRDLSAVRPVVDLHAIVGGHACEGFNYAMADALRIYLSYARSLTAVLEPAAGWKRSPHTLWPIYHTMFEGPVKVCKGNLYAYLYTRNLFT